MVNSERPIRHASVNQGSGLFEGSNIGDPLTETESPLRRLARNLTFLYGEEKGAQTFRSMSAMMREGKSLLPKREARVGRSIFGQQDIALITFPDAFQKPGEPTLRTLGSFLQDKVGDAVNTVHVLPFNPSGGDRGFSPIDYSIVDPRFGDWEDIAAIGEGYSVMADLVVGHRSTKSKEFQDFLAGDPRYQDFFIAYRPEDIDESVAQDLQRVRRPRVHPLLTEFPTFEGPKMVWTTFSTDQVDVNYKNPQVLLNMVSILLKNLQNGVNIVRIDALTYAWKELGTECVNLPQTHALLQVFRDVLEEVVPESKIISETNVPHDENISYFGTGENVGHEAHMVYNFALPPLVLNAFYTGNAQHLSTWATSLEPPSQTQTAFFNFLSSHDGIGVMGAKGILPEVSYNALPEQVKARGGKVSSRALADGGKAPYELNATWWSALTTPDENFDVGLRKFITSHAISFALQGVPAVYYHSLFGSENNIDQWERTHVNRDINERKLNYSDLAAKLDQPDSRESQVLRAMKELMRRRKEHQAFSPSVPQKVLDIDQRVFALQRGTPGEENILAFHNVSGEEVRYEYEGKTYVLEPFGYLWESVDTTQNGTVKREIKLESK